MTEEEWLAAVRPEPMLAFVRAAATGRKVRLFACGCCRRLGPLLTADTDRLAVELGEGLADAAPVQDRVEELRLAIDWRQPGAAKYAVYPNAAGAADAAQQVVCDTLAAVTVKTAVRRALDTEGETFDEAYRAGQKAYASTHLKSRFLKVGNLHVTLASSGASRGEFGSLPLIHVEC